MDVIHRGKCIHSDIKGLQTSMPWSTKYCDTNPSFHWLWEHNFVVAAFLCPSQRQKAALEGPFEHSKGLILPSGWAKPSGWPSRTVFPPAAELHWRGFPSVPLGPCHWGAPSQLGMSDLPSRQHHGTPDVRGTAVGDRREHNGPSLAPPAVGRPYGGGTHPMLMDAQQMLFKS